jgi:hypothetical protein
MTHSFPVKYFLCVILQSLSLPVISVGAVISPDRCGHPLQPYIVITNRLERKETSRTKVKK